MQLYNDIWFMKEIILNLFSLYRQHLTVKVTPHVSIALL